MIQGIHHISIIVSSEDSISFYNKLGFNETKRINREYDTVAFLNGYGIELVLFIDPEHTCAPYGSEYYGIRRLALKVDNIETIREEFDCGPILRDWFGKAYCITQSPDGLAIEFHE